MGHYFLDYGIVAQCVSSDDRRGRPPLTENIHRVWAAYGTDNGCTGHCTFVFPRRGTKRVVKPPHSARRLRQTRGVRNLILGRKDGKVDVIVSNDKGTVTTALHVRNSNAASHPSSERHHELEKR
ncbi:hypothetical protein MRX96_000607 [Rhipicephalus microplus]